MKERMETKVDEFFMAIREKHRVPVEDLKVQLGVDDDLLEKWIIIFEERGLIERVYPANPLDPPYLVIKHGKE